MGGGSRASQEGPSGSCDHRDAPPELERPIVDLRSKLNASCNARTIFNGRYREHEQKVDNLGDDADGFHAFSRHVRRTILLEKLKSLGITKYDGK